MSFIEIKLNCIFPGWSYVVLQSGFHRLHGAVKDYKYTVNCEKVFLAYVTCSRFFLVHLLFEIGNSEGISRSSFYTESYIQKL